MSDQLNFGSKVVFAGGNPITLPVNTSDPGSAAAGDMYFNSTSGLVRIYDGSAWSDVDKSVVGMPLDEHSILVGDAGGLSASVDSSSAGDILADSASGLTIKSGVIVDAQISASAAIAYSKLDLSNSILNSDINSSAAIALSKLAAVTSGKALVSDGSGFISASSTTATEIGYVSGVTSAIQTQINNKISSSEKGANNGVATLDSGGKVPVSQLPNSVMEFKGNWDADTNSPSLADGTGNAGDVYRVNVAGTQDLGSGSQDFVVGDWVVYSGSIWQKSHSGADAVTSVNGFTGVVSLGSDDIAEGSTNLYFTDARAQAAAVADSISDGVTDVAPSQNAVFDALALKANDSDVIKKDGSVAFTGDQSLGTHSLTNVADPTDDQDAATKKYVDDQDATTLSSAESYADGKVENSIVSGHTTIAPSGASVFTALAAKADDSAVIKKNGSVAFTADQSMGTHKLTNLGAPSADTDASTKKYADDQDAATLSSANSYADGVAAAAESAAEAYADGKVENSIVSGHTDIAPSGDAVFTALAGKEATITAGTTSQYYRGDKSFQTLNTTAVAEGTNLYFTSNRAKDAAGAALDDTATIDLSYNSGTHTITADIQSDSITDAHINSSAAIAYSKLDLASSVTASDMNSESATMGYVLTADGSGGASYSAISTGSVTSVALTVPSFLSVSGSPITSSGTFAVTLANQNANKVFAGPATGSAAAPTFRSLDAADMPDLSSTYATLALDNLASVALNTALLPASDGSTDLGSSSKHFGNAYTSAVTSGGDLTLSGSNAIVKATILKQSESSASSNFKETQYFDAKTLAANTSSYTAISGMSFAHASFRGAIIDYTIREASSDKQRVGRMFISTDGTVSSSSDQYSETAKLGSATGLSLTAAVNGANIEIQFNNTHASNACTLRAEVTRFRA